jgi:CcdB protein
MIVSLYAATLASCVNRRNGVLNAWATTRLVAPISRSLNGDVDVLAPPLLIEGIEYRARVLDITAVPVSLLGESVASLVADRDAVMNAIDMILHGYPVR